MQPTSVRKTRRAQVPATSIALFVDAEYVRRAAARSHEMISGSRNSASRVSIDACQISRLLDSLIVDFELESSGGRPGRRIYETVGGDRRRRWRQVYYRSALSAEGFVLRTVRVPRRPGKPGTVANDRDQSHGVRSTLADDLVRLARELTTVVLLAGGGAYAPAVAAAREHGTEVVVVIAAGCEGWVGEPRLEAATRVITLHPEVFEALSEVHDSGWRRRHGRVAARSASAGAAC
jgi:NYN domain